MTIALCLFSIGSFSPLLFEGYNFRGAFLIFQRYFLLSSLHFGHRHSIFHFRFYFLQGLDKFSLPHSPEFHSVHHLCSLMFTSKRWYNTNVPLTIVGYRLIVMLTWPDFCCMYIYFSIRKPQPRKHSIRRKVKATSGTFGTKNAREIIYETYRLCAAQAQVWSLGSQVVLAHGPSVTSLNLA